MRDVLEFAGTKLSDGRTFIVVFIGGYLFL